MLFVAVAAVLELLWIWEGIYERALPFSRGRGFPAFINHVQNVRAAWIGLPFQDFSRGR
jgi:hypothetical protein